MLRTSSEKIALYAGYIIIICITLIGYDGMGLYEGCSIQNRLSYPFFHQNIFHAAVNLYVFHQCYRAISCGIGHIATFYLIAIRYQLTSSIQIIGLSGFMYADRGVIAPYVGNRVRYNVTILIYICIRIFVPCMAVGVHIYCYVLGLLWGYLNAPLCKDK